MACESIGFLAVSAVAFGVPLLSATSAFAHDAAPSATAPVTAFVPTPAPADEDASRISLRPFLTNAFDKRSVTQQLDTGAPGGGTYVQRVPQAAGLTLKAAL